MRLSTPLALLLLALPVVAGDAAEPVLLREQKLVRAHLNEKLPNGAFEELKWFSEKSSNGGKLWDAEDGGRLSRIHHDLFRMPAPNGAAVRLKYRTKNKLGVEVINDKTFFIVGGKVVGRCDSIDLRFAGEDAETWGKRTGYSESPAAERIDKAIAGQAGGDDSLNQKATAKVPTHALRR